MPTSDARGTKMPTRPSSGLPLRITTAASRTSTVTAVNSVVTDDVLPLTSNGASPSTTSPPRSAATTTASNEARPSSAQYTSFRYTHSANSSRVSPAPIPNRAASTSFHGLTALTAKPRKPLVRMSTMPHTRWCRCSPPLVLTLPGHHGTRGLRMSRALVRMNRNDARNAASATNPAR